MARGAVAEILRLPGPAGDSPRARTPSPAPALGAYAAGELGVLVLWECGPCSRCSTPALLHRSRRALYVA